MTFALQLNVLHWQNRKHAEQEILCLDMFRIHLIFNDRLTLIPHISGLSTQWQVHMVCFSEMHPNPLPQPHVFICIHPPPSPHTHTPPPHQDLSPDLEPMWGLLGINNAIFRCRALLWSSSPHHTTPLRLKSDASLARLSSRCILVYLSSLLRTKDSFCFLKKWNGNGVNPFHSPCLELQLAFRAQASLSGLGL